MTTPRIEEMVEEFSNKVSAIRANSKELGYAEWARQTDIACEKALTKAYQAGIDEAVEVLKSKKQMVSQLFLDRGDQEMVTRAILNHRIDDTIKALQNNVHN